MRFYLSSSFGRIFLAAAATALILTSCGNNPKPTSTVLPPPKVEPSAEVSSTRAEFVFPIASVTGWKWYLDSTPARRLEYRWSVSLDFGPGTYSFGFWLFNLGDPSPASGDIHDLIEVGQKTLFWSTGEGGTAVRDTEILVSVEEETVVIAVEHPRTFGLLFSERPGTVAFHTVLAAGPPTTELVPVHYIP